MVFDTLGKIFHVNFLGFAHLFMSIIIYQLKDHSISVDQARYATSIVAKYLNTATVKVSNKFYKTTLPADMILHRILDIFIVYKSGLKFCSAHVSKVFS